MLSNALPLLLQDRQNYQQQAAQIGQSNPIFETFLKQYQDTISHRIQSSLKKDEFHKHFQQDAQITQSDTQEYTKLQQNIEILEKSNQAQQQDIQQKDATINQLNKNIVQRDFELIVLKKELEESQLEIIKQNRIAIEQANDIKQISVSRDQLTIQIEKITIENSQLIEMLKNEKLKMADNLNEINDLYSGIQNKQKILQDEECRINKRYSALQSNESYSRLAPKATEAQLDRNINSDVPSIVARKLTKFHSAEIYDIALNLNGSLIATCGGDRFVKVFDPLNLQSVSQFQPPGDGIFTSLCFSSSFECLLLGSTDNTAQLWQVSGWKLKAKFLGHSDQVIAVNFVGGEKDICISGSKDRQLKLWNINNGSCVKSIATSSMITALSCQHNTPLAITAHKDGSLRGYTLKHDSKPVFHEKQLFDDSITSITLSSDNNSVLLCSKDGFAIKMYDLRMNKIQQTFYHDKYMNSYDHNKACFGPDERYIIAGNADSTLVSWKAETAQFHKQLQTGQHEGVVLCVAYHPVTGQMFSGDSRGNLVVWR